MYTIPIFFMINIAFFDREFPVNSPVNLHFFEKNHWIEEDRDFAKILILIIFLQYKQFLSKVSRNMLLIFDKVIHIFVSLLL